MTKNYSVAIIGAGVTGTSLAYLLSKYTKLNDIVVLDKYQSIASVNSNSKYNSQTLHCGDIETNYTLEKARQVLKSANLVKTYALAQNNSKDIIYKSSKLLLGVGDDEVSKIESRYELFKDSFEYMSLMSAQDIAKIEPNITKDRADKIVAMGVASDYCAVDFGNLSKSFIDNAIKYNKDITLKLDTKLIKITRQNNDYQLSIKTNNTKELINARFVVFATGAYSLTYAKKMGYGLNYGLLSVAGSFYFSKEALNGKVYTVQNDKLPFAAVHGDPDVNVASQTRFGPTALILPQLERYKHNTYLDYIKVTGFDKNVLVALYKLIKDKDIRNYILVNFAYEIPNIGKKLFLREVQKIIPSLRAQDLRYAKGFGGLRPQIIDKDKQQLILGEAHIDTDEGLIFNITPSPGASTCLQNSLRDSQKICQYFDMDFSQDEFNKDFDI